jgi:glycosyltransferase involved in cell wall biosynthesis
MRSTLWYFNLIQYYMQSHFKKLIPVENTIDRPLWTVVIPVYNCAKFLEITLKGVLDQKMDSHLMEILVVDDCSTDNPEEVVKRLGNGLVSYYRQNKNVGHTANFEKCLELSRGKYIHLLHGDDCVLPDFYIEFTDLFDKNPSLGAAFCMHNFIDENSVFKFVSDNLLNHTGVLPNFFELIVKGQIVQTPSIVVKREVYESIGIFDNRLSWCEDWEMWTRIGKYYSVGFIDKVLAEYRMHSDSNSGKYVSSGENVRDLRRGISIINEHIEDPLLKRLAKKEANNILALRAISQANTFLKSNKNENARNQLKAAFFMSKSIGINFWFFKTFIKTL